VAMVMGFNVTGTYVMIVTDLERLATTAVRITGAAAETDTTIPYDPGTPTPYSKRKTHCN